MTKPFKVYLGKKSCNAKLLPKEAIKLAKDLLTAVHDTDGDEVNICIFHRGGGDNKGHITVTHPIQIEMEG